MEPTPQYKEGKEPKYDKLNRVVDEGEEETILYQFHPDNKLTISENIRKIDAAMKVIPSVVIEIRRQLKNLREYGTPMNLPEVPRQEKQPSIWEKLGIKQSNPDDFSRADQYVEELISYIYEIRDRWGYWKEWFYGSIKYPENRGTWSDIYSRRGMERLLTRLTEFFDYWVITRFVPIHQYAMDNELEHLKLDTNEFVKALARMTHETQSQQPGF